MCVSRSSEARGSWLRGGTAHLVSGKVPPLRHRLLRVALEPAPRLARRVLQPFKQGRLVRPWLEPQSRRRPPLVVLDRGELLSAEDVVEEDEPLHARVGHPMVTDNHHVDDLAQVPPVDLGKEQPHKVVDVGERLLDRRARRASAVPRLVDLGSVCGNELRAVRVVHVCAAAKERGSRISTLGVDAEETGSGYLPSHLATRSTLAS